MPYVLKPASCNLTSRAADDAISRPELSRDGLDRTAAACPVLSCVTLYSELGSTDSCDLRSSFINSDRKKIVSSPSVNMLLCNVMMSVKTNASLSFLIPAPCQHFSIVRKHFVYISSSCSDPESKPGPSSVMELLRPEDRDRLLNLRNSSNVPSTTTTPPAFHDALLPAGSPAVAGAASSGLQQEAMAAWRGVQTSSQTFRPFEKNPSKQARYELYLNCLKQGDKGRRLLLHVPSCTAAASSSADTSPIHVCSSFRCFVLVLYSV